MSDKQKPNTVILVATKDGDWEVKQKVSTLKNKPPKPNKIAGES